MSGSAAPTIDRTPLTTPDMAQFVARGFLAFPGVVPAEINEAAEAELGEILATWGTPDRPNAPRSGQSLGEVYPAPSAIGEMLRLPVVAGAIESLVGANPRFDHDFVHLRAAGDPFSQHLHQDAIIDPSPNLAFDIQVFEEDGVDAEPLEEWGGDADENGIPHRIEIELMLELSPRLAFSKRTGAFFPRTGGFSCSVPGGSSRSSLSLSCSL